MTRVDVAPSPHLSWDELCCYDKHRTPYPLDYRPEPLVRLVTGFEGLRAAVSMIVGRDCPLAVTSAYRTPQYNRLVKGEPNSYHVQGMALDVACGGALSTLEFALVAVRVAKADGVIRGVGFYPDNGFVHFDVRPKKALALWRVVLKLVHGKPTYETLPWSGEDYA